MIFLSLKIVLILANSTDHDEMQYYALFHLSLHCLSKGLFRGLSEITTLQVIMTAQQ